MSLPERALGDVLGIAIDDEAVRLDRDYPIAGVYGFGRGLFKRGPIRSDETSYPKLNRLTAGRLVMSRLKAFEGAIAVIPPEFDGWYLSPEFPTFSINAPLADTRYIANLCAWPEFWKRLGAQSKGLGARKVRVSADRLMAIKVPLPDLDEQRRIAARLDSSMKRIDALTIAQTRAANLRTALISSLFSGVCSQSSLRTCLIPGGDLVAVDPEQDYQIAGIFSFGKGLIRRPAIRGSETSYATLTKLHTGQLVMSKLNAWEGALAVVPDEFDASYVSSEYPVFDIDHKMADPTYIANLARWPGLWGLLTPRGSMVRRKRASPSTLLDAVVPLPALGEQRRIGNIFKRTAAFAELAETQASHIKDLRSVLLNLAFSGGF